MAVVWSGVLCERPASVAGSLSWYLVAFGNVDMGDGTVLRPGDGVQLTSAEATAMGTAVTAWAGPTAAPTTTDVTDT